MTWPLILRVLAGLLGLAAVVLAALYLVVASAFPDDTPWARWQRRMETARVTTVLDRPQVLDGVLFPAGATITWEDPSHRRLVAVRLASPTEILGVRATDLRRVVEGGWIVSLATVTEIDGWICARGEVELTTAGRLWDCRLSGAPSWRGWSLPERTSVQPRPDLREVWLTLPAVGAWDTPLASPVLGKLPWIVAFNEDGSPSRCSYGREKPYPVAGQQLSGEVQWQYDPATDGMGRERPPVAVSGSVYDISGTGTRRHVVLPWPGYAGLGKEKDR